MSTPTPPAAANTATTPILRKGLEGVIVDQTAIGDVDGAKCELVYRGYSIDELAGKTSYEEVCYLLLFGDLPTRLELGEWSRQLAQHRALEADVINEMQTFPMNAAPMAVLRTVVSMLGLYDPQAEDDSIAANRQKAIHLIAKIPTIVAAYDRLRRKQPLVQPHEEMGHAENFLYMLHGKPPSELAVRGLDMYLVLLAEHGFNASTFSARTTLSTKSDFYSAITAAVGTLKGDLHGSANRKAMEMLMEIGAPDHIDAYVNKTLENKDRFMGFGHRVYKGPDPRAKHLKEAARKLGEAVGELKWFRISEQLQETVHKAKGLYINVDFYSASLLYYLGIPVDCFTPMFACSRIAGWSAHLLEQYADNRLIRPLSNYVGPRGLTFTPIEQRKPR